MASELAYSDAQFNKGLEATGRIISRMLRVRETKEYFTTAYLVYPETISIKLLTEPLGASAEEGYEVALAFGKHLSQDHPVPQAVFVATQAVRPDRSGYIWISGCTPDSRRNLAELSILSTAKTSLEPGEFVPTYYEPASQYPEDHTLAQGLIQGFLEGPSAHRN